MEWWENAEQNAVDDDTWQEVVSKACNTTSSKIEQSVPTATEYNILRQQFVRKSLQLTND